MRGKASAGSGDFDVAYKTAAGEIRVMPWEDADPLAIADGRPWREFPWYLGQRHYSGMPCSGSSSRTASNWPRTTGSTIGDPPNLQHRRPSSHSPPSPATLRLGAKGDAGIRRASSIVIGRINCASLILGQRHSGLSGNKR